MKAYSKVALCIVFLALNACKNEVNNSTVLADHTNTSAIVDKNEILLDETKQLEMLKMLASDEFEGRATGHQGGIKARDYIATEFSKLTLNNWNNSYLQSFKFKGKSHHDVPTETMAHNVIAYIQGTQFPDKYIVLGAHYDHLGTIKGKVYNGADDNASGTAALIAIAKYLKQHPPKHSVVFAAWDAEELGLQGAKYFVDNAPVNTNQIVINLNLDMIGRNKNNELYICGSRYHEQLKTKVVDKLTSNAIVLKTGHDGIDGKDDWTFASDHGPFYSAKIPFLYFGVEDHPDYHKDTDEFASIQPKFYIEATKVILQTFLMIDKEGL